MLETLQTALAHSCELEAVRSAQFGPHERYCDGASEAPTGGEDVQCHDGAVDAGCGRRGQCLRAVWPACAVENPGPEWEPPDPSEYCMDPYSRERTMQAWTVARVE